MQNIALIPTNSGNNPHALNVSASSSSWTPGPGTPVASGASVGAGSDNRSWGTHTSQLRGPNPETGQIVGSSGVKSRFGGGSQHLHPQSVRAASIAATSPSRGYTSAALSSLAGFNLPGRFFTGSASGLFREVLGIRPISSPFIPNETKNGVSLENTPLPLSLLLSETIEFGRLPGRTLRTNLIGVDDSSLISAVQNFFRTLPQSLDLAGHILREPGTISQISGTPFLGLSQPIGPQPLQTFQTIPAFRGGCEPGKERTAKKDYFNEARRQPYEKQSFRISDKGKNPDAFQEAGSTFISQVIGFLRQLFRPH